MGAAAIFLAVAPEISYCHSVKRKPQLKEAAYRCHFHREISTPDHSRPTAADMLDIERRASNLSTGANVRVIKARVARIKDLYRTKPWTSLHSYLWRLHILCLNTELVGASLSLVR